MEGRKSLRSQRKLSGTAIFAYLAAGREVQLRWPVMVSYIISVSGATNITM